MTDSPDNALLALLAEHRLPGLSFAVIGGGQITRARSYGFADPARQVPVTADTRFQAASISKCLTALATLRLVDQGRLALDEDVNGRLQSWKIPAGEFIENEPVTLRRLLSHQAGINVHGFAGYAAGQPLPTLTQILNGTPPANNAAIHADTIPGTQPRYSGGGYTVLQQLLMDVTGQPFAELMQGIVLQSLGLNASTFVQPLPAQWNKLAATGHDKNGQPIPGGAHSYPEMAAAGLWTTPSDLAKFALGIQHALAGRPGAILSPGLAREMLTVQSGVYGLGPSIAGSGPARQWFHSGRNAGFDAVLLVGVETGKGVAIMTNANVNSQVLNEILKVIWAKTD